MSCPPLREGESRRAVIWQCDLTNYRHGGFVTQEAWFVLCFPMAALILGGMGTWAMKEPANYVDYIRPRFILLWMPALLLVGWQVPISLGIAFLTQDGDLHGVQILEMLKLPTGIPLAALFLFIGAMVLDGFARFRLARAKTKAKKHPGGHADD